MGTFEEDGGMENLNFLETVRSCDCFLMIKFYLLRYGQSFLGILLW